MKKLKRSIQHSAWHVISLKQQVVLLTLSRVRSYMSQNPQLIGLERKSKSFSPLVPHCPFDYEIFYLVPDSAWIPPGMRGSLLLGNSCLLWGTLWMSTGSSVYRGDVFKPLYSCRKTGSRSLFNYNNVGCQKTGHK